MYRHSYNWNVAVVRKVNNTVYVVMWDAMLVYHSFTIVFNAKIAVGSDVSVNFKFTKIVDPIYMSSSGYEYLYSVG